MTTNLLGPVSLVNGFMCKTCTDIDYAKQHIDPAHPKDGPYGIYTALYPSDPPAAPDATAGTVATAEAVPQHVLNAMA